MSKFLNEVQTISYEIIDKKNERLNKIMIEMGDIFIPHIKKSILEDANKGYLSTKYTNKYFDYKYSFYLEEFTKYLKQISDFEGFTITFFQINSVDSYIKFEWNKS